MTSNFLLKVSYWPRAFAYLLAATMVVASGPSFGSVHLVCALAAAMYPHLLGGLLSHCGATDRGVRMSLLLDSLIVGQLLALVGFHLLPGAALLTLLILSVLILAGPGYLLTATPLVIASAFASYQLGLFELVGSVNPVVEIISLVSLFGYVGVIAWLVYREARRLDSRRKKESWIRRDLETLQDRLRPFLPPQVIGLETGDTEYSRKRLTVFFSDIEGFTRLMDEGDEVVVARLLNEYLEEMSRIAELHGGTIDKFIGDGVMILFGDLESDGAAADARRCISMALEMRTGVEKLSQVWQRCRQGASIHIRMGIHTGYCLVGNFGSVVRMDYTALGSAVNLASRLEAAACRDEILISADTWKLVSPWVQANERRSIHVKGFVKPVSVYSVTGASSKDSTRYRPGNLRLLSNPGERRS